MIEERRIWKSMHSVTYTHKPTDRTDYNALRRSFASMQFNESGTEYENSELRGPECSTICSRDVDDDADRQKEIRSL